MFRKITSLFSKKIKSNRVAKSLYKFDEYTGFWGMPDIERDVQTDLRDEPINVSHNSDGNRDNEISEIDPKGSIVVIGGSHSWGGGLDKKQRYSDLLATKTGKQVINMGHASLGIDQACIAIMKKTSKYNPRFIVIEQYPWAVIRILSGYVNGYVKPVFSIDDSGNLKLKKVPKIMRFSVTRKILGSYYAFKKELQEYRSGIDLQNNYDPLTDPIFLYWKINHYDYLYTLLEKILIVIRDYCRQHNIHLLLALGAIHQQFIGTNNSELIDYELPRKRLADILDKLEINYVDMTDEMMKNHSNEEPVIFHDGHINAKGNDVFANVLQSEFKSRGWV